MISFLFVFWHCIASYFFWLYFGGYGWGGMCKFIIHTFCLICTAFLSFCCWSSFFFLPVLTCSFGGSLCFLSAPLHWWQCLCILSALLHWWLFCLLFVFPSSMVALFLFFVCLSSLVAVLQPQLKPCLCRKESVRGFYKGFSPYMIHVTPNICIVFLLYELMTNTRQEPSITFKTEVAEVSDSVWVFLFALNLGFWAVFCIVFGDV